ncbi:targeting protein for Xklp2 homolog [Panonychus citri]|uniref:targeting protein for Xklp2 homolog n=1 Tax=Panonychus citri TaxID=50023 RepID=UPI00230813C8|nr:targeting protein for Xklp2 homolog [Panonychus citri]
MSNTSFFWEFACPKYVDFTDSKVLELNGDEVDSYFDLEHEFSFQSNLGEGLKVESLLAEVDKMASPVVSPVRPASSSSNYRTPDGSRSDLESDDVFYTTRKSYSLRETECRRLTQIGASPYRIPGGTTTNKKKSRRTPLQPRLIEENAKQVEEEEILVENLKKALFLDDENEPVKQKDENGRPEPSKLEPIQEKENSFNSPSNVEKSVMDVTQNSNDYSMELMAVSQDIVTECVSNVCSSENDDSMSPLRQQLNDSVEKTIEKSSVIAIPEESTAAHTEVVTSAVGQEDVYYSAVDFNIKNTETAEILETNLEKETNVLEEKNLSTKVIQEEHQVEEIVAESSAKCIDEKEEEKESDSKIHQNIPEIRVSPQIANKSASTSSDEGYSKSSGGLNSDSCWTDVDDENVPGTSAPQERRRRPLRRESFVKSSATLASTVKKVDPQKKLYRLLSYTAPPRNKYRSLAELSRDFETKIRAYTPSNLKTTKAHWTPTKPVSPKLTACKRKRTLTCVSHKEQEENIAQSIKKNTFKATPFNKKTYLSTVNVGVKRVDPKPTTKPIPFSFRSEKRLEARRSKVPTDLFNKLTSQSARKGK